MSCRSALITRCGQLGYCSLSKQAQVSFLPHFFRTTNSLSFQMIQKSRRKMVRSPSRDAKCNCVCGVCPFWLAVPGLGNYKNTKLGDNHVRSRSPISFLVTETHMNFDKKPCVQVRRRLGDHRFVGGQTATGPGLFDPSAPRCDVVMSGSGGWRVRWSPTHNPAGLHLLSGNHVFAGR